MKKCECGCGEKTTVLRFDYKTQGYKSGDQRRFIVGHSRRKTGLPFVVNESTGCWEWSRYTSPRGYGRVTLSGKPYMAHQVFYWLFVGKIPEGKQLDHLCRVRKCVNPKHLEPVTNAENAQRGGLAKLTKTQVRKIRKVASGIRGEVTNLARRFNVSKSCISTILRKKTWR